MAFRDIIVTDWQLVRKKWSARFNAAGLAILGFFGSFPQLVTGAWSNLPDSIRSNFPAKTVMWLGIACVAAASLSQYFRQPKLEEKRADAALDQEK